MINYITQKKKDYNGIQCQRKHVKHKFSKILSNVCRRDLEIV